MSPGNASAHEKQARHCGTGGACPWQRRRAIQEISGIIKSKGFQKAFIASEPDLVKFQVTKKITDLLDAEGMAYEVKSGDREYV